MPFVLGAAVGAVCAGLLATLPPLAVEPRAAADGGTSPSTEGAAAPALNIFAEATSWPDDAPPPLGAEYNPVTIRSVLGAEPWTPGYGVYVARRVGDDVCIIVQQDNRSVNTACTSPAALAEHGLTVQARVAVPATNPTNPTNPTNAGTDDVVVSVDWNPDGSIVAQTSTAAPAPAPVTPYTVPTTPAPSGEFHS